MQRLASPRVLIALGAVLLLLFAAGAGCGASRGGRDPRGESRDPPVARAIGSLLVEPLRVPVGAAELRGPCLQASPPALLVPANGDCMVAVAGSLRPVRTLTLRLAQGNAAQVVVRPTGGVPVKGTLTAASRVLRADVFREGAEVVAACAVPCRLDLQ